MRLTESLQDIYERQRDDLPAYAWESEAERWMELVFCVLCQCAPDVEPESVRTIASTLRDLGIVEPGCLAALPADEAVTIRVILTRSGFSTDRAETALRLLTGIATVLQREYGGTIQGYLRSQGKTIREAFVTTFSTGPRDAERLRGAATHWLQNALSLPVSLLTPAVLEFCRRHGATPDDLFAAADELDINVALVDDLLELEEQAAKDRVDVKPGAAARERPQEV